MNIKTFAPILLSLLAACDAADLEVASTDQAATSAQKPTPTPTPTPATNVSYDNVASGLSGTNVQAAIDEVVARLSAQESAKPKPTGGSHAIAWSWNPVTTNVPVVTVTVDEPGTYMVHGKLGVASSAADQAAQQVECFLNHLDNREDFVGGWTQPYTAVTYNHLAEIRVLQLDGNDNKIELVCHDLSGQGKVQVLNPQIFAIRYK